MSGGGSFTSDQSVAHVTSTDQMVPVGGTGKTNRTRLTSVQAKGATNGSIIFRSGGSSGDVVATFLFDTEGLDLFVPGSGILFKDGIHATVANTGGVTITFT